MTTEKKEKKRFGSPLHIALAGFFCLALVGGMLAAQVVRADGRILPNVSVGGVDVGGLTPEQAKARLHDALRALNVGGLQFHYRDRSLTLKAQDKSDASGSGSPITYDIQGMADAAFAFGHGAGTADLLKSNMQALLTEVRQPVLLSIDDAALRERLHRNFGDAERPASDAGLDIRSTATRATSPDGSATGTLQQAWQVDVIPDSTGVTFDYDGAISAATAGLMKWQGASIELQAAVKSPDVTTEMAMTLKDRALKVLRRGGISLAYDDQRWTIEGKSLAEAIRIRTMPDGTPGLTLKPDVLEPLLDAAAKTVETEARPTHFTLDKDGRARDFVGGSLGVKIDRKASLERIDSQFESSQNGVFPLAVTTVSSGRSDALAEQLGIRELLGYGTSHFSGSPKNRRQNIANGAARLNGLVIAPGEEVGLLQYLKPFDASGGYVQELVIKNNRTVPEYGGGLCQIGTTTFRAVMASGLPVTARQNHSYRVVYYEPAGTDATIYDPAPDFKFVNDTQSHAILITKISGDDARFELWGTRDGRVQAQSPVKMWNVTPPPEPKLIETSSLKEGAKKCFETPHAGATTNFTYTITYPDGTVKSQDFRSVYKPWQQQCLIGKDGAPNIILQKDGAIKELPPTASASTTPTVSP